MTEQTNTSAECSMVSTMETMMNMIMPIMMMSMVSGMFKQARF